MKINYKWIAAGILVGYLLPYMIALVKSYQQPEAPAEKKEENEY